MDLGRRDHTRWLGVHRVSSRLTLPTANLLAAWDARAGVTNVSGACSAWADQSGNGFHATQGTAGSRPTISTADGHPSLLFNGSSAFLSVGTMPILGGGIRSVYAVVKLVTTTGTRIVFYNTGAGTFYCGHTASKYAMYDVAWRSSGIGVSTALSRLTYSGQSGSSQIWRGVTAGAVTGFNSLSAASAGHIGGAGADYLAGHILWLGVYNAARNTAVEAYLLQEFGV